MPVERIVRVAERQPSSCISEVVDFGVRPTKTRFRTELVSKRFSARNQWQDPDLKPSSSALRIRTEVINIE
jgi:hypothetical protein